MAICEYRHCRKEFTPIRPDQKFCSKPSLCRIKEWELQHPRLGMGIELSDQKIPALFHNTINLQPSELEHANKQAAHQEDAILNFYQSRLGMFTPCECAAEFPQWPITSIRRAITNLTKRGLLVKTHVKRKGIYGMVNNCWSAA